MTEKTANPPANSTDSLPVSRTEPSENDQLMDSLRPYLTQIGLFVAFGLLGLIAITLFINSRQNSQAEPWQELTAAQSEFAISGNVDRLTQVATTHPDTPAAMWALQSAGDYQLRRGIDQLREDREKGFELIGKSKTNFQEIIDAPASAKSPDLQQASVFSMAYASESLGEFDDAAKFYSQLIEEAPDSHFADAAKRGVARSTNPDFAAAFKKFKEFEEVGEAPGPNVPERPEIDFPEVNIPADKPDTDEVMPGDSDESGEETKLEQPEVKAAETDEEAPADPASMKEEAASSETTESETVDPQATETEVVEPKTTETEATELETADPVVTESTEAPATSETPTTSDVVDAVEEAVESTPVVTPDTPAE